MRGASEALGIHPRAVAAAAKRLGLGKAWKVSAKAGERLGRSVAAPARARRVDDPQPSRRPAKPRVDWAALDLETRGQVEDAVAEIKSLTSSVPLSLREIERRIGRRESWIYLRRSKLPVTMAFLEQVIETVEQFQERRLRNVIRRDLEMGVFLTPSGVVRAASLKWEVWADMARTLIAEVQKDDRLS